jgi:hypothetical protein
MQRAESRPQFLVREHATTCETVKYARRDSNGSPQVYTRPEVYANHPQAALQNPVQ